MSKNRFYVYVIFRPNGVPCYVGKGQGKRWLGHRNNIYNKHLRRIIDKFGDYPPAILVRENISENDAFEIERALIRAIGRADKQLGPLVNLTDGGEGQSGWVPSEETRKKISSSNTGKVMSLDARIKMSAAGKGRKKSSSHKIAIGLANVGRKLSEEGCQKIRERALEPDRRKRASEAARKYHANLTPEQRKARSEKIRQATKAAVTPEIREHLSKLAKKRHGERTKDSRGRYV